MKSKDKKFAGYKAHIAEDESQIVTSCETLSGNENEGSEANLESMLQSMLQKEDKRELKTEALVRDALYDSLSNRLKIEKRKKKYYVPEKREKKRVNDFIYSDKEDKLICGKGYSFIGKSIQEDGYLYYFSCNSCRGCDRRKEYSFDKSRARIYVSDSHLLYLKADPEEKKRATSVNQEFRATFPVFMKYYRGYLDRVKRVTNSVLLEVVPTFILGSLQ